MEIQVIKRDNDHTDYREMIFKKLNEYFFAIPEKGRMDEFEERFNSICVGVAQYLGSIVSFGSAGACFSFI